MARVTAEELKEIIETDKADTILDTFIVGANLLVTEHLGGSTLTDAQLKEIERWLAAHLLASTLEKQPASEGADKANVTYQGQTALRLDFTSYGQMVQIMDTTGVMATVVGQKKASLFAITSFK